MSNNEKDRWSLIKPLISPEEKIEGLKEKLKQDPENSNYLKELSFLLLKQGRYDEFLEDIKKNIELGKRELEVEVLEFIISSLKKEKTENRDANTKKLEGENTKIQQEEANLEDEKTWFSKGIKLKNLGKFSEARECFEEAIRINPNNAKAHYLLGYLMNELREDIKSRNEYKEAIRINPNYVEECRKAARINPNDAEAHNYLGILLFYLEGFDEEAEEEYREAIRINPNYIKPNHNLADLLLNLERFEEAMDCYNELIRINPNDAEAWFGKGQQIQNLEGRNEENEEEILNCYDEARRISPDRYSFLSE